MPVRPPARRRLSRLAALPALLALLPALSACMVLAPPKPEVFSSVSSPGRAPVLLQELRPGVWRLLDTIPMQIVSLAVVTDEGLVLVDTPATPAATEAALRLLSEKTGAKPALLFLTHFHVDRFGGAAAPSLAGVPVACSQETASLLATRFALDRETLLVEIERRRPSSKKEGAVAAWEALRVEARDIAAPRPNRIVSGKAERFVVGGVTVDFLFPGRGHTSDNRVVHFPRLSVLFAGDLLQGEGSLGELQDADIEEWHDTAEALLAYDAEVVLPGRGNRVSPNLLLDTMAMLKRVDLPDLPPPSVR